MKRRAFLAAAIFTALAPMPPLVPVKRFYSFADVRVFYNGIELSSVTSVAFDSRREAIDASLDAIFTPGQKTVEISFDCIIPIPESERIKRRALVRSRS